MAFAINPAYRKRQYAYAQIKKVLLTETTLWRKPPNATNSKGDRGMKYLPWIPKILSEPIAVQPESIEA